jgi:hypothetical protein
MDMTEEVKKAGKYLGLGEWLLLMIII